MEQWIVQLITATIAVGIAGFLAKLFLSRHMKEFDSLRNTVESLNLKVEGIAQSMPYVPLSLCNEMEGNQEKKMQEVVEEIKSLRADMNGKFDALQGSIAKLAQGMATLRGEFDMFVKQVDVRLGNGRKV